MIPARKIDEKKNDSDELYGPDPKKYTSWVWKRFRLSKLKEKEGFAKCNTCLRWIKSVHGTKALSNHLKSHGLRKPEDFDDGKKHVNNGGSDTKKKRALFPQQNAFEQRLVRYVVKDLRPIRAVCSDAFIELIEVYTGSN